MKSHQIRLLYSCEHSLPIRCSCERVSPMLLHNMQQGVQNLFSKEWKLLLSPSHVISYAASSRSVCVDQFLDREDVLGTFLPDAVSQRESSQSEILKAIALSSRRSKSDQGAGIHGGKRFILDHHNHTGPPLCGTGCISEHNWISQSNIFQKDCWWRLNCSTV